MLFAVSVLSVFVAAATRGSIIVIAPPLTVRETTSVGDPSLSHAPSLAALVSACNAFGVGDGIGDGGDWDGNRGAGGRGGCAAGTDVARENEARFLGGGRGGGTPFFTADSDPGGGLPGGGGPPPFLTADGDPGGGLPGGGRGGATARSPPLLPFPPFTPFPLFPPLLLLLMGEVSGNAFGGRPPPTPPPPTPPPRPLIIACIAEGARLKVLPPPTTGLSSILLNDDPGDPADPADGERPMLLLLPRLLLLLLLLPPLPPSPVSLWSDLAPPQFLHVPNAPARSSLNDSQDGFRVA